MPTTPKHTKPAVLLFHGRGLISAAIRLQTRSEYSHAALLMPDGQIVEAWQGAGVRVKALTDWSGIDIYDVPRLYQYQWNDAIDFALRQVGQGYDYKGVLRFLTRQDTPENGKWFCSELVFAAMQFAGLNLLERIPAAEVSPGMLRLSPHLELRKSE